ncbi:MAG TPA: hypothetical protein VHB97_13260, partial [Polyangia bacterium]|nr:hypothetical protein [Polyangia bacterium]
STLGCNSDSDCGQQQVCSYVGCCGSYQCTSPCTTNNDCGDPSLACDSGGHCYQPPCGGDNSCPAGYSCNGQTCARTPCTSDSDCGGEYCVDGYCYSSLGVCGVI